MGVDGAMDVDDVLKGAITALVNGEPLEGLREGERNRGPVPPSFDYRLTLQSLWDDLVEGRRHVEGIINPFVLVVIVIFGPASELRSVMIADLGLTILIDAMKHPFLGFILTETGGYLYPVRMKEIVVSRIGTIQP